jgi:hypothetical protein
MGALGGHGRDDQVLAGITYSNVKLTRLKTKDYEKDLMKWKRHFGRPNKK